ncbi:inverse autotransporter beta domain-containing protein [Escherichia albertii]|uniref:inverse autotransporter beta domain-containing protein n=1 Tax=Escherichia albertii TaxID=208962 RepID=UPI000743184D|nr:inverse autotransporter beta domain-containing protein [Escherichia albertii]EHW5313777.1 inverse autotransporter beta domain-containing protein [Escherichia albertii]MCZ8964384.1 inverse autotransporter beta domain-containing protein [Escherichia albertii]MCZ9017593.1 inverse autotransporter beta domain-containing protein [Escherichia albertii]MCZ9134898.1 inverse autotransporter beta domain-containing protein [Escherichia albertii]
MNKKTYLYKKTQSKKSRAVNGITWLNILIQIAYPFAGIFSSNVAYAENEKRFISQQKIDKTIRTKPYTLTEGDTLSSIAKKYNMNIQELKKINQFRGFSRGIENVTAGDEIDVPVTPFIPVIWENDEIDNTIDDKKLSSLASQTAISLSNYTMAEIVSSKAREMAIDKVNSKAQQWLNHFGNARVKLDTDEKFSLQNSQVDLLVPLYEKGNSLLFSQGSLHYTDDRFMSNLGVGYRRYNDGWMLGGNTFFDYDLSRDHARLGAGVEYWRDFLKLGVNGYFRITNWKNSPDMIDYEERPANGWDIHAQTWIPALPQLGAELGYEQYYGENVALFGKNKQQRNPHAMTIGVNYTPFPLLTFNTEYKEGRAGENDARIGVQVNYQPGIDWKQQINPDAVATMRTLAGNRYDFVERNNNIVLEYKKKEIISLKTVKLVSGYAGEKKSLGVSVNSKYGVERINWTASELISAGGKIVSDGGTNYSVILPDYQYDNNGVNTYTIQAVAIDKKGNVSEKSEVQVTVTQAAIDVKMSTLSPESMVIPADGKTQKQLVLKINDKKGNPVDLNESEISIQKETKNKGATGAKLTPFIRQNAGEYVTTLTAGTEFEKFSVIPVARNTRLASADITITKEYRSSLNVMPTEIIAGKEKATVRVIVRNANGDLQDGMEDKIKLSFSPDLSITPTNFAKVAEGVYEAQVSGKKSGITTISASVNGAPITEQMKLNIRADKTSATVKGNISVTPTQAMVGETVTYMATLVDKYDNVLGEGIPVTWSTNSGSTLGATVTNTDRSGTAKVTLTRLLPGIAKVSLILPSETINAPDVLFSEGAPDDKSSVLTLTPESIMAGKEFAKLELLLKDKKGNPLSGQIVKGVSDNNTVTVSDAQEDDSNPGHYTMIVTGSKSGVANLSVMVNNKAFTQTKKLTVKGDADSWQIAQVVSSRDQFVAGDNNGVTYSVTVTDAYGNKLPNVVVSWQLQGQAENFEPVSRTDNNGVATTKVKSNISGKLIMTAYLDEKNKKQASTVTVIPGALDTSKSSFSVDKKSIGADGKDTATMTVILKDKYDNGITGKKINIDSRNSLTGFSLSPAIEAGNGIYQVRATSTNKGQVTLQANVDGEKIGSDITITVGATTPEIRFDNAQHKVSYVKNFTASQTPKGIPDGVQQMWSSSLPEVASVDSSTGQVKLHKSGVATITVQTSGNGQYNPAQASYELIVDKASPRLKSAQDIIQTKWNDNIANTVNVLFDNPDVGVDELSLEYAVDDRTVATVSSNGTVTKIKPGSTNITVSTKGNEKFKSETIKIPYILNKGIHSIEFSKKTEETNSNAMYKIQSPNVGVPVELETRWESSNPNAIKINEKGEVISLGEGQSRLTLSVLANEFYEQSSGYYDVEVYTKPVIGIYDVQYTSQGESHTSGEWKPFYTSDSIKFNWRTQDKYKAPSKVSVALKNQNTGENVYSKEYTSIEEFENKNETIAANKSFWDKNLVLEIIYHGRGGAENSVYSKNISVKALTPPELKGIGFSLMSYIAWSNDNSPAGMCRKNLLEGLRHVIIAPRAKFDFGGNTLIEPLTLDLKQVATQGYGAVSKEIISQEKIIGSGDYYSSDLGAGSVNSMGSDCWENYWGNHTVEAKLKFRGKTYTYKDSAAISWDGFGRNMSGKNNFKPLSGTWN